MSRRIVPLLIYGYFGAFFLMMGLYNFSWRTGYGHEWFGYRAPREEQPVAFSHRVHVMKMNMECTFCHVYAERSPRAGVPHVQTCVECHEAAARDKPEVKKILDYWERKEPIPWIKVHDLPDHVYFSHKRHVRKGVECRECHGEVQYMAAARQVRPLTMGWCVTCHEQRGAPKDCLTCHK
jgi:DnaJ-class molecular chaperone